MAFLALLFEPAKLGLAALAGALCARWVSRQLTGSRSTPRSRRIYHGAYAPGARSLTARASDSPPFQTSPVESGTPASFNLD